MSFFNSSFEEFIYIRTYSRWIDALKQRETWDQTVARYGDFMKDRVPGEYQSDFDDAVKSILNQEIMPSMRSLWTAGKALERENICGYNCFNGNTKFLTDDGVKILKDSVGKVKVLNKNQKWVDGEVKNFGKQKTVDIKLGYNQINVIKNVTLDHDWHLLNGNIVKTKNLKHGDIIPFNKKERKQHYDSIDYKLGVLHGIIYGDGTAQWKKGRKTAGQLSYSQKRVMGYTIRLCSDQNDLLPYFGDYEKSYPKTYGGDPVIYMYDSFAKTHNLKELPREDESEDYIVGFIRGWFAADGYVSKNSDIYLCMDDKNLKWSKSFLPKYGYYLQGIYQLDENTNLGKRNKNQYSVRIDRASFSKDDILIKRKQERFKLFNKNYTFRGIIDNTEKEQDVFCVVEPETHTFTLDGGVLTGNCSATMIDDPAVFSELLYILMCGAGTGFSVERQAINKMPNIPSSLEEVDDVILFADSKLGWAEGFAKYIRELYKGNIFQYDTSKIRTKGERLKTFGGRASGPEPLIDLLEFTKKIFINAKGRKLNSIECHDLACYIASVVVVGGVRRSATISLSNLSDNRMAHAKDGNFYATNPQRALANNSVAYTERPDCMSFLDEWIILARSQSGERGIFNREGVIKHLKKHVKRRNPNFDFITNPCVPYNTLILTDQGYKKIGDTVGKKINIWNGKEFSEVEPFYTGNKELYNVLLSNGVSLKCTCNHKWVLWEGYSRNGKEYRKETGDLIVGEKLSKFNMPIIDDGDTFDGDAYSQGFYTGDGTKNNTRSYIYEPKYCCESRLIGEIKQDGDGTRKRHNWIHGDMMDKEFTPVNGTKEYCLNWFAGYIDADGHTQKYDNSYGLQITSIKKQQLLDIQLMLTRLGCCAKVNKCSDEQIKQWSNGNEYITKDVYRLCLNAQDLYTLHSIGMKTNRVNINVDKPQRDARRFVTIESIKKLNKMEDVYCFNEPLNHTGTFNGVVTGQCGEIILRSQSFCNLSEVVIRADDNLESLLKKVENATILGCVQSTLTKFKFLRKQWTDNAEEERLLGVSLTGLRDHPILNHVHNTAKFWLEEMKEQAIKTSKIWSHRLGINEPTAVTCVKPSGTVSLLNNTASGLHTRFSKYYIRRVRVSRTDPLCKMMMDQGFNWNPENGENINNYQTAVFEFPIKSPENAICNSNIDAIEMLEYWKMLKIHWCEHNPSCTIFVKDDEWVRVGNWIYDNWNKVGGLTFLPAENTSYQLAPYEEITSEQYDEMVANTPKLDFSQLTKYELEDQTKGAQELACSGGACELGGQ